jgi:hypothetical protein
MKQEIQKVIWDREQITRIKSGNDNNQRRLGRIFKRIKQLTADRALEGVHVLNIGIGNGLLEQNLIEAGYWTHSLDPSRNAVEAIASKLKMPAEQIKVVSCDEIPLKTSRLIGLSCLKLLSILMTPHSLLRCTKSVAS